MAEPEQQQQQQQQQQPSLTDTAITPGAAHDGQSASARFHSQGRLPPVVPHKGEDPQQRATASQKAYDWATQTGEGSPPRARDALGPEEQGDFGKPYTDKAHAFAAEAFLRTVLLPAVMFSVVLITGNRPLPVSFSEESGTLSCGSKPVNGSCSRWLRADPRNARVRRLR